MKMAMGSSNPDVLIVGAGPVGLTMAAALAHYGVNCRIIDKAPRPTDKSKALVVWSRTMELLQNLNLADRFVQTGMKIHGASIYGDGRRLVHLQIEDDQSPYGFPLMIPQSETERLLTEDLERRGIAVERSVELLTFVEDGDRVVGRLQHADGRDESFAASWLVGCDGAHSTVRHTLNLPFTGAAEQNDWLLADIHVTGAIPADELSIYWHQSGILAFFPITPTRFRVIADLGTAAAVRPPDPTLADVQAIVRQRGPVDAILSDPVWLAGFRINERKVANYRVGRIFLAGDAAHIHSPAGGQGMNTGMQDSFNLAWKLSLVHKGLAKRDILLDSYSTERSEIGDQVLRAASVLTTVATLRNPLAQSIRNTTASVLGSFRSVQDKLRNQLRELSIHYRNSPITDEAWSHWPGDAGIPAGSRLPDDHVTDLKTGRLTTLFQELCGSHFHLLLIPDAAPADNPALHQLACSVQTAYPQTVAVHFIVSRPLATEWTSTPGVVWVDTSGNIVQRHAIRQPALILVRPDGYIGYRASPASEANLLRYLDQYLIAGK
jgi:2-polyprenyl-6-methoxyphenol hydroxylase-like FAD-dependent oxidoreductase